MNTPSENTSIAEIVTQHPHIRNLLEEMGIDYCCGGKQTLKGACDKGGLSVQDVIRKLIKGAEQPVSKELQSNNWSEVSLTELVQHIITAHHGYLKEQLPRLKDLVKKVYNAHQQHHGETIRKLQQSLGHLQMDIEMHLAKEERILFPWIKDMEMYAEGQGPKPAMHCGSIENPIRQMEQEHESAGHILGEMRSNGSEYQLPDDACESFKALYDGLRALEKDLHEHIHLENNILFPKAVELERKIGL